jgi:hypothetical protein
MGRHISVMPGALERAPAAGSRPRNIASCPWAPRRKPRRDLLMFVGRFEIGKIRDTLLGGIRHRLAIREHRPRFVPASPEIL